jgi:hypothetical protein
MPANTSPIFIASGNFTPVRITGPSTSVDGSVQTNLVQLVTAGANGTRVDGVRFRNSQATPAPSSPMIHRVYLKTATGIFRLIGEVFTVGASRSATVLGATSIVTFDQPLILKLNQSLWVGQTIYVDGRDQFDAIAYAGNY